MRITPFSLSLRPLPKPAFTLTSDNPQTDSVKIKLSKHLKNYFYGRIALQKNN